MWLVWVWAKRPNGSFETPIRLGPTAFGRLNSAGRDPPLGTGGHGNALD